MHDLQKVLWSILGGVNLDIFQNWNWKMKLQDSSVETRYLFHFGIGI